MTNKRINSNQQRSTLRAEAVLPFQFTEVKGTWKVEAYSGGDHPYDNGGHQCSWGTKCALNGDCDNVNNGWVLFGTSQNLIKNNENNGLKLEKQSGQEYIKSGATWPPAGAPSSYTVAPSNVLRWQSSQYGNNKRIKIRYINLQLCKIVLRCDHIDNSPSRQHSATVADDQRQGSRDHKHREAWNKVCFHIKADRLAHELPKVHPDK